MELWSSGNNVDMKVDLNASHLGAVSTWMGDLIRIPSEGFEIHSFSFPFPFYFFCFHLIDLFFGF